MQGVPFSGMRQRCSREEAEFSVGADRVDNKFLNLPNLRDLEVVDIAEWFIKHVITKRSL